MFSGAIRTAIGMQASLVVVGPHGSGWPGEPASPDPGEPASASMTREMGKSFLRLIGIAALLGIPAALVAAGFLALVHEVEDALWPDDPAWYLVLLLPAAGATIVLVARRFLPG